MQIRIVGKSLGMVGQNLSFKKEDFFGLKPEESIIQIGNGKENGTIRTDRFEFPIKYVGSIICQFDKPEKMFAFLLPKKIDDEDIYLLYGTTGSEIFTEALLSKKDRTTGKTTGYMRFYAPVFTKANS
ncbi:hypothetical protein [Sphingobacterium multivorum]|uniref:hypothetical protein n=1 Tax=Sphingobacterium multivorum TaxID=28454 RepID=UPI000EBE8C51|nr:hypothetical protein [Sphingobacterium sp.]